MSNRKRAQSNELGDKSDYSKNTKTANPFKKQRGLPPFIPRSSIEKLEFNIDCAAGEPNPSQFKISQGLLITEVPQYFHPPLDYGDHVLAVNGEDIRDKLHFISLLQECQQFNLPHTITFLVERVKATNQIDIKTMEKEYANLSDNVIITNDKHGFEYFEGTLVFFPRAAVGISVKAVNRKVYIDSTDNGFNSIGRRIFFIGDVVIAVNNTPCYTVAETGDMLLKALKRDCIVTVILERAIDPMAILFVRTALNAGKAPQMDPKMQDDIVLLCKEEVNRMIERIQNKTKPPKPILRDKRRKKKYDASTKSQHSASLAVHGHHTSRDRHVEFLATSKEMTIGMDLWNPTLLMKVPGLSHNRAVNGVLPQRRKARQSTPPLTLPPSSTPPR